MHLGTINHLLRGNRRGEMSGGGKLRWLNPRQLQQNSVYIQQASLGFSCVKLFKL